MSILPENDTLFSPDDSETRGGWRTPGTPTGWKPSEEPAPRVGWRVPSLPKDLTHEPAERGQWHLPSAEDTIFTAEDEIEVSQEQVEAVIATAEPQDGGEAGLSPEDMMMNFQQVTLAEPEPEPMKPLLPEDMMASLRGPTKTRSATDADGDGVDDDVNAALDSLDEDDDESFSMSELVALASLVEEEPDADVAQGSASPQTTSPFVASKDDGTTIDISQLSPAERAVMGTSATSDDEPTQAIDYAQEQLRRLQGADTGLGEGQVTTLGGLLSTDPTTDPAEYARRQLAQLGGDTGPTDAYPVSPPQVQQIDPRQAELTQKFRHTRAGKLPMTITSSSFAS